MGERVERRGKSVELSRWQFVVAALPLLAAFLAVRLIYGTGVAKLRAIVVLVLFTQTAVIVTMMLREQRRQAEEGDAADRRRLLFRDAQFVGWVMALLVVGSTVWFESC